jgi:hypothetical protein
MREANNNTPQIPVDDKPVEIPTDNSVGQVITTIDGITEGQMAELYKPFAITQYEQHSYHKFFYVKEEAINRRLTKVFGVDGWSLIDLKHEYIPPTEPQVKAGSTYIPLSQFELEPLVAVLVSSEADDFVDQKISPDVPIPISVARTKYEEELSSGNAIIQVVEELEWEKRHRINSMNGHEIVHPEGYFLITGGLKCGDGIRYGIGTSEVGNLGKGDIRITNTAKGGYTDLLKRLARLWGIGLHLTELTKSVKTIDDLRTWLHNRYPNDPRYMDEKVAKLQLVKDLEEEAPYFKGEDLKDSGQRVKDAMTVLKIPEGGWVVHNYFDAKKMLIDYATKQAA